MFCSGALFIQLRNFTDYMLTKAIRDVLRNGLNIDTPPNLLTLGHAFQHGLFGIEYWINAEVVNVSCRRSIPDDITHNLPVKLQRVSVKKDVLRMFRIDKKEIKFSLNKWPSPLQCNLMVNVARVLHAMAEAGLYEMSQWDDDGDLLLRMAVSETMNSAQSSEGKLVKSDRIIDDAYIAELQIWARVRNGQPCLHRWLDEYVLSNPRCRVFSVLKLPYNILYGILISNSRPTPLRSYNLIMIFAED